MTLDEAIAHAEEVASGCGECADEHRQLVGWLKELADWKRLTKSISLPEYPMVTFHKPEDLERENAKLRQIVLALDYCTENHDFEYKCDNCPLPETDPTECNAEVMMRELGVETWQQRMVRVHEQRV